MTFLPPADLCYERVARRIPVFRFETKEQAIHLANDTGSGLACCFYTHSLSRAFRVSQKLQYGLVGLNEGTITAEVASFGASNTVSKTIWMLISPV